MTGKDWINLIAILIAPILAVQAQKWIERLREKRLRKLTLFRTLMATRATPVAPDHVRALNSIDLEFYKNKKVISAWKAYLNLLEKEEDSAMEDRYEDLFTELLAEIGKSLNYDFDKTDLKKTSYMPIAHSETSEQAGLIREGWLKVLKGESSISVAVKGEKTFVQDKK